MSHDQIAKYLQADSLGYLNPAGMVRATGRKEDRFCMACFTNSYPVPPVNPELDKLVFERRRERGDSVVSGEDPTPGLFD
jgi:amidophosphoribosyltransferase